MKPHLPRFGVLIDAADRIEFVSWIPTRAAAEAELFLLRAAGKEALLVASWRRGPRSISRSLLVGELAPWAAVDKPVPSSVR
jgi:hypothetical protein